MMSIRRILAHGDDEVATEIGEDGELYFPEIDITYDLALVEMGLPASAAVEVLRIWEDDATEEFMFTMQITGDNGIGHEGIIAICSIWMRMIVERSGVDSLGIAHELRTKDLLATIEHATAEKDHDTLRTVEESLGNWGAYYQQAIWLSSGPTGIRLDYRNTIRLAVCLAFMQYASAMKYVIMDGSHEESKSWFLGVSYAAKNMVENWMQHAWRVDPSFTEPGDAWLTHEEVSRFRKKLVGAAVTVLAKKGLA